MIRLDKFVCDAGAGSRSQIRQLLKTGRVTVNDLPEKDGSRKIFPETDRICLDGVPMKVQSRIVIMMNKPAGYITATEDSAQPTVMDLLPPEIKRRKIRPAGRLDKDTEGLLLFTDDGDLLHQLISPGKAVQKAYRARHEGTVKQEDVAAFSAGIVLADGTKCLPAELEPLGPGESMITVCEGKYHQVKRMMASRGLTVTYLERLREGALVLGSLERGAIRELSESEIQELLSH